MVISTGAEVSGTGHAKRTDPENRFVEETRPGMLLLWDAIRKRGDDTRLDGCLCIPRAARAPGRSGRIRSEPRAVEPGSPARHSQNLTRACPLPICPSFKVLAAFLRGRTRPLVRQFLVALHVEFCFQPWRRRSRLPAAYIKSVVPFSDNVISCFVDLAQVACV
jgi:hypothetical protein